MLVLAVADSRAQDLPDVSPSSVNGTAEAGEGGSGSADSSTGTMPQSLFDYLLLSGVCGALIVVCSVISLGLVFEHLLTIRRGVLMPDELVDELDELIRKGKLDDAMEKCRESPCLFTNVVLAALERYRTSEFGFAEYRAAAEEAGEEQTARLYRKTEALNVIGAISPMLGLTGTVLGMIKSFNTIAATGGTARPDQLAAGISEALITTLMGLFVAIPTMVCFSYFRNRIDSLVAEAGRRIEQVLMPLGRRMR
ncbi:MAG: hypothetical protein KatS3mg082_3439 [Nitrospiraceae bacterium]|nr:MAG: hypothetical protein KatS3mg082_3439 [Nitrospiraceae bacterium]